MLINKWYYLPLMFIVVNAISSSNVIGLSSWFQNVSEFNNGIIMNTTLKDNNLSLDQNMVISNNWTELNILSSPSPRWYQAMANDPNNQLNILFGGANSTNFFNDTWTYNVFLDKWLEVKPIKSPSPRSGSAMAYDSQNNVIVLFGGLESKDYVWINDTWIYNLTLNTWVNMSPVEAPPASRYLIYNMAFDPIGNVCIAFGGGRSNYPYSPPETWTYAVKENLWKKHETNIFPPARTDSAMVYDETSRLMVLFGGYRDDGILADTWTLRPENFSWTRQWPSSAPSARNGHAMIYDSIRGVSLLFGGGMGLESRETWSYDSIKNSWVQLPPTIAPMSKGAHKMFYNKSADAVILFGGWDSYPQPDSLSNETWIYRPDVFYQNGTYTSKPKDLGGTVFYGTMRWDASIPINTCIRFQLRSADTLENLMDRPFIGPDGTNSTFYGQSGQHIASVHNGSHWIQLKAFLITDNILVTPRLNSIEISYNLLQNLSISSPLGAENWTGIQNITWAAHDDDNDSLLFDIYLENSSKTTLLANGLSNETREWSWNTSMIPNGTYYIRIVARDDNPSIPLIVNATSGNITIFHPPPPNHPPHINLISPLNNSIINNTTVHLIWNGTDIDGDLLTYTCIYSNNPQMHDSVYIKHMTNPFLDIINLTDNTTYYWTVDATDGKSNGTDIPTEIWSFSIKLPKINHPPKITSKPQLTIQVGENYDYNITAVDEDKDTLTFSLFEAPYGLVVNSSNGRIHWIPTISDIGNRTIILQVSDGQGGTDQQTYNITIVAKPLPEKPWCVITYPTNNSKVSGKVKVQGLAMNGSIPVTLVQVRIDGGNWICATGLENWTIIVDMSKFSNGGHRIEARAFDGNLFSGTSSVGFIVNNPEPPTSVEGANWWVGLIIVLAIICFIILSRYKDHV